MPINLIVEFQVRGLYCRRHEDLVLGVWAGWGFKKENKVRFGTSGSAYSNN